MLQNTMDLFCMADGSAMKNRMAIYHWLDVELLTATHFCHHTPSCGHQHSHCRLLLMPIINHFPQVVSTPASACPLPLLLLVGWCIDVCCHLPLLSSHVIVQPSMLLMPALLLPIVNRCPSAVSTSATACLCCSCCWLIGALLSTTRFCHCMPSSDH